MTPSKRESHSNSRPFWVVCFILTDRPLAPYRTMSRCFLLSFSMGTLVEKR